MQRSLDAQNKNLKSKINKFKDESASVSQKAPVGVDNPAKYVVDYYKRMKNGDLTTELTKIKKSGKSEEAQLLYEFTKQRADDDRQQTKTREQSGKKRSKNVSFEGESKSSKIPNTKTEKARYLQSLKDEEKGAFDQQRKVDYENPERYVLSYTSTSQQLYFESLAREHNKGQKQKMYDELKKSADERRNPEKNKMLSTFEKERKGGSRGEGGESSVTRWSKKI